MVRSRVSVNLLPLLLCISMFAASAELPPTAMGPPADSEVAAALAQIQDTAHWVKAAQDGDSEMLAGAFDGWSHLLIRMSAADQRGAADRVCSAISALHEKLPKDAVHTHASLMANSFIRDAFRVGNRSVQVAQYFVPEPYYPNDPNLTKLYRFSVYQGDEVVLRYFLEHSQLGEQHYYVLGKADLRTRAHYQVQPYGGSAPSYWNLQQRVVQDLSDPKPSYAAESAPSK